MFRLFSAGRRGGILESRRSGWKHKIPRCLTDFSCQLGVIRARPHETRRILFDSSSVKFFPPFKETSLSRLTHPAYIEQVRAVYLPRAVLLFHFLHFAAAFAVCHHPPCPPILHRPLRFLFAESFPPPRELVPRINRTFVRKYIELSLLRCDARYDAREIRGWIYCAIPYCARIWELRLYPNNHAISIIPCLPRNKPGLPRSPVRDADSKSHY